MGKWNHCRRATPEWLVKSRERELDENGFEGQATPKSRDVRRENVQ